MAELELYKNYKIVTAPVMILGIPMLGWGLSAILAAISANILIWLLSAYLVLTSAGLIFFISLSLLAIKTKQDPDWIQIQVTKITKIRFTVNKDFKGNCYVA